MPKLMFVGCFVVMLSFAWYLVCMPKEFRLGIYAKFLQADAMLKESHTRIATMQTNIDDLQDQVNILRAQLSQMEPKK